MKKICTFIHFWCLPFDSIFVSANDVSRNPQHWRFDTFYDEILSLLLFCYRHISWSMRYPSTLLCFPFITSFLSAAKTRKGTKDGKAKFCRRFCYWPVLDWQCFCIFSFPREKVTQLTFLRQSMFQLCNSSGILQAFNFVK